MSYLFSYTRGLFLYLLILGLFAAPTLIFAVPLEEGTIDDTAKYARIMGSDDLLNFNPTNGDVEVSGSAFSGYIWGEVMGWINLAPANGGVSYDNAGTVSGYAWGEDSGWINFNPTNGGVTIDDDGNMDGYAWSENFGWIVMSCDTDSSCGSLDHQVKVNFSSGGSSGGGSGSGGGGSSGDSSSSGSGEPEGDDPVIVLLGSNPFHIEQGSEFTDPGAEAQDNEDGDISEDISIEGDVDTSEPGTYILTYSVEDSDGNESLSVTREIIVYEPGTYYSPYCGDGVVNQEWEQCDGGPDCLETCQLQTQTQCSELALARVQVSEVKNWGNADMTTDVSLGPDTIIPTGVWFALYHNGSYVIDEDITQYSKEHLAIERRTAGVRVLIAGSHSQEYYKSHINGSIEFSNTAPIAQVSDNSGNNKLERGFDGSGFGQYRPGDDEVFLNGNSSFFSLTVSPADDAFFTYFNQPVCSVPVESEEDTPSTSSAPIITLNDEEEMVLVAGESFVDPGAQAFDTQDGDITDLVLVEGSVDPEVVGVYTLTYAVTDSDGEQTTVTRTVTVIDSFPVCGVNLVENGGFESPEVIHPSGWDLFVPSSGVSYLSPNSSRLTSNKPASTRQFSIFELFSPVLTASAQGNSSKAEVTLCHVPPGNPNNARTISVSQNAIRAHEKNGSYPGTCDGREIEPASGISSRRGGITPDSPLYIVDQVAEGVRELITFDPKKKAKLNTDHALERVLEINALLEDKGVDAPGLDKAAERLSKHLDDAVENNNKANESQDEEDEEESNEVADDLEGAESVFNENAEDRREDVEEESEDQQVLEEFIEVINDEFEETQNDLQDESDEEEVAPEEEPDEDIDTEEDLGTEDFQSGESVRSSIPGWSVSWVVDQSAYRGADRPEPALLEVHRRINQWLPAEGSQYVELDGDWNGHNGSLNGEPASVAIYQDIETVPGEKYEITFSYSARPNVNNNDNALEVRWGNELLGQIYQPSGNTTEWKEYTYVITAESETSRIEFRDAGISNSFGTLLDAVSVRRISADLSTETGDMSLCIDTTENTPPVISLLESNPLVFRQGSEFQDPGAVAHDAEDGDLSSEVEVLGEVNVDEIGQYVLTYQVSDSQGLTADPVTRSVSVVLADYEDIQQCGDGVDNDDDGLTDFDDPNCHTDGDSDNPISYNSNINSEAPEIDETDDMEEFGVGGFLERIQELFGDLIDYLRSAPDFLQGLPIIGLLAGGLATVFRLLADPRSFSIINIRRPWNGILSFLGLKRRPNPWGTVYDSETKVPVDPAYISLHNETGQEITSSITDLDGRYGFLVPPGRYTMGVRKTHYAFPSDNLSGRDHDVFYENLYFGGNVTVTEDDVVIIRDIPMDPIERDWNQEEKVKRGYLHFYSKHDVLIERISSLLFYAGFSFAIIAVLLNASALNIAILSVHIIVVFVRLLGKPQKYGKLFDRATGEPLPFALMKVFDADTDREVRHTASDHLGRYYCLVPPGEYYVKIGVKKDDDTFEPIFTSDVFKASDGFIDHRFKI